MNFIPKNLTRNIGRQILIVKKDSPRLLFGLGIVGTIASTVLACRATLKLEDTLDDFQAEISGQQNRERRIPDGGYTRREYNKDMAYIYAKGSMSIVRLYAPAILVGATGISLLTGSHVVLERRNASLSAAYSALNLSYNEYRKRVAEEWGTEKELDVYHAAKTEKLHEDGVKTVIKRADPNKWSPYAKFFDESNQNWHRNAELNRMFVQCQQTWANDVLKGVVTYSSTRCTTCSDSHVRKPARWLDGCTGTATTSSTLASTRLPVHSSSTVGNRASFLTSTLTERSIS